MYQRNWPLIITITVAFILTAVIGWAIGRWSAPDSTTQAQKDTPAGAVRVVDGVPIGIQHSRAGALAAADNYVAVGAETVVQDPPRYERLVRQTYAVGYQGAALREGSRVRRSAPQSVDLYASGGKSVAVSAARRLDSYQGRRASTTTWVAGITLGSWTCAGPHVVAG